MQKALPWLLIVLSFIGIVDASYLSHAALTGSALNCAIFDGCNIVAASPYAKVFGVPLALFGLFFYVVSLAIAAILLTSQNQRMRQAMFAWSVIGVLFSIYFTYLQLFRINAVCLYCVISAVTTVLLFIWSSLLLRNAHA